MTLYAAMGPGVRFVSPHLSVLLAQLRETSDVIRTVPVEGDPVDREITPELVADPAEPAYRFRVVDGDHPEYAEPEHPGWPARYVGGRELDDAERAELAELLVGG